ncbi:hypothetical protein QJQ45_025350, partial [Haematococcus lacustris]
TRALLGSHLVFVSPATSCCGEVSGLARIGILGFWLYSLMFDRARLPSALGELRELLREDVSNGTPLYNEYIERYSEKLEFGNEAARDFLLELVSCTHQVLLCMCLTGLQTLVALVGQAQGITDLVTLMMGGVCSNGTSWPSYTKTELAEPLAAAAVLPALVSLLHPDRGGQASIGAATVLLQISDADANGLAHSLASHTTLLDDIVCSMTAHALCCQRLRQSACSPDAMLVLRKLLAMVTNLLGSQQTGGRKVRWTMQSGVCPPAWPVLPTAQHTAAAAFATALAHPGRAEALLEALPGAVNWVATHSCNKQVDVAMAPQAHGDAMDTASGQVGADHQCASQLGPLPARTAGGVATDSSTATLASASWAKDTKHVPADKMPASTTTHLSTLNTSYGHCIVPLGTALPSLVQLVTAMAYWPQLQPCLQASNVCTGLLQLMKWRPFHSPLHSAVGQLFCTIISHGAPALLSDLLIRNNLLGQLAQLPTTVPSTQGRMLRAGYMGVLAQIFDCMTATMQREEGEHADLDYRSTDKQHQQQHQQQLAQHAEESMEDASAITRQLFNIEDATSISAAYEGSKVSFCRIVWLQVSSSDLSSSPLTPPPCSPRRSPCAKAFSPPGLCFSPRGPCGHSALSPTSSTPTAKTGSPTLTASLRVRRNSPPCYPKNDHPLLKTCLCAQTLSAASCPSWLPYQGPGSMPQADAPAHPAASTDQEHDTAGDKHTATHVKEHLHGSSRDDANADLDQDRAHWSPRTKPDAKPGTSSAERHSGSSKNSPGRRQQPCDGAQPEGSDTQPVLDRAARNPPQAWSSSAPVANTPCTHLAHSSSAATYSPPYSASPDTAISLPISPQLDTAPCPLGGAATCLHQCPASLPAAPPCISPLPDGHKRLVLLRHVMRHSAGTWAHWQEQAAKCLGSRRDWSCGLPNAPSPEVTCKEQMIFIDPPGHTLSHTSPVAADCDVIDKALAAEDTMTEEAPCPSQAGSDEVAGSVQPLWETGLQHLAGLSSGPDALAQEVFDAMCDEELDTHMQLYTDLTPPALQQDWAGDATTAHQLSEAEAMEGVDADGPAKEPPAQLSQPGRAREGEAADAGSCAQQSPLAEGGQDQPPCSISAGMPPTAGPLHPPAASLQPQLQGASSSMEAELPAASPPALTSSTDSSTQSPGPVTVTRTRSAEAVPLAVAAPHYGPHTNAWHRYLASLPLEKNSANGPGLAELGSHAQQPHNNGQSLFRRRPLPGKLKQPQTQLSSLFRSHTWDLSSSTAGLLMPNTQGSGESSAVTPPPAAPTAKGEAHTYPAGSRGRTVSLLSQGLQGPGRRCSDGSTSPKLGVTLKSSRGATASSKWIRFYQDRGACSSDDEVEEGLQAGGAAAGHTTAPQDRAALVVHSHSFSVPTVLQQPQVQGASLLSAQPHVPPSTIYRAHSTAAFSGRKVCLVGLLLSSSSSQGWGLFKIELTLLVRNSSTVTTLPGTLSVGLPLLGLSTTLRQACNTALAPHPPQKPCKGPSARHTPEAALTACTRYSMLACMHCLFIPQVPPKLDFSDNRAIFRGQPTSAVLRALLVFHACGWSWFVAHAEQLLSASKRLLGTRLTLLLVRKSFFDHFCGGGVGLEGGVVGGAGETSEEVWLTMRKLEQRGIGAILDFAAEDDMQSSGTNTSSGSNADGSTVRQASQTLGSDDSISTSTSSPQPSLAQAEVQQRRPQGQQQHAAGREPHQMSARVVARQYSYKSEVQCDAHVDIFLKSIHAAAGLSRQGFTAVKLTALGNPLLLQRISLAIREVRGLFARFDADGSGSIDQAEFQAAYREMLPDADTEEVQRVFSWLQGNQAGGKVDYVAWCQRLSLTKMPEYAARIQRLRLGQQQQHSAGSPDSWVQSLQALVLSEEEVQLVTAMRARLHRLAQEAAGKGVRLMVDAEHTYFQPAIDHLTLELMRDYNRGPAGAVIFNTYQAYLTDSHGRLQDDLERSRREGYVLGAKLAQPLLLLLLHHAGAGTSATVGHASSQALLLSSSSSQGWGLLKIELTLLVRNSSTVTTLPGTLSVRGAYLDLERRHAAKQGQPSPVWTSLQATHDNYHACMELLLQAVVEGRAEVLLGTHNQASVELAVARMSELGLQPQGSNVYFGQLLGMSDHLT